MIEEEEKVVIETQRKKFQSNFPLMFDLSLFEAEQWQQTVTFIEDQDFWSSWKKTDFKFNMQQLNKALKDFSVMRFFNFIVILSLLYVFLLFYVFFYCFTVFSAIFYSIFYSFTVLRLHWQICLTCLHTHGKFSKFGKP